MREFDDHYEEEYLYLADLTDTAALISWGKFFFASTMELVPDRKIHLLEGQHGRHTSDWGQLRVVRSCGCRGAGRVRYRDSDACASSDDTFTWVTGLTPDTEYTYRVIADPEGARRMWADGPLWDYDPKIKELIETSREGTPADSTRFHRSDASAPLTFAVIGDTGTGTEDQKALASALEAAIETRGVRLALMTGDTVYQRQRRHWRR